MKEVNIGGIGRSGVTGYHQKNQNKSVDINPFNSLNNQHLTSTVFYLFLYTHLILVPWEE